METTIDIWQIVNELLVTVIGVLIAALGVYVRRWLTTRLSADQLALVGQVSKLAVQAAEQYGGNGDDKKRQAMAHAQAQLAASGVQIDLNLLNDAVEAAVYSELNRIKPLLERQPVGTVPETYVNV